MPEDSSAHADSLTFVFCVQQGGSVHAQALKSIIDNYEVLQKIWDKCLDFVKETEMRSRIQGVSACINSFDFYFGLLLGELLLNHSDNLNKTLQTTQIHPKFSLNDN